MQFFKNIISFMITENFSFLGTIYMTLMHKHTHIHTLLPMNQKLFVCTLKHGVFKATKDATMMGRK